ncbi:M56 family metallopeptidase [Jannaschia sp. M317]|uniref:M56 family metallopeptidase n=1 Tax=Jannaschia sp. M317 TaxID=2867011 RepID=UPI0021A5D15D|nr:M56 family metallopeptidase [Jannaschia sp. M317]UWQ18745.1 M56 family metallopeptidase [Jannaschia sp. M317]
MADWLQLVVGSLLAVNAALVLAVGLLWLAEHGLTRIGLDRDWALRRRVSATAWVLALGLPFALTALPGNAWNATDVVVGLFLNGNLSNLSLTATEFQSILAFRDGLPRALVAPASPAWQAVAAILLAAALMRALHVMRAAWCLRRLIHASMPLRETKSVRIAVSGDCPVPFAARGLRRNHVVLPAGLVADPEAFRIALAHELQHIRQGDPIREVLVAALSPLFALNPAFWNLSRHMRRLREHHCDAACVARPTMDARDYSLCLLDVARRARQGNPAPGAFTVALLGRKQLTGRATRSQLGHRIELIAKGPSRRAGRLTTLSLLAVFAVTLAGTTWTLRPPADWSQERLMLSSVINLERLETINTLSQRPLR